MLEKDEGEMVEVEEAEEVLMVEDMSNAAVQGLARDKNNPA